MRWMLVLWLLIPSTAMLRGQSQVLEDTVFTLGTVTRDATDRNWAYVVLQPTDPELLARRKLAVYVKSGAAASAGSYERRAILTLQTDPAAISALLQRAAGLGDDLELLNGRVTNLFSALIPSGNLSLAELMSVVIRGAVDKPTHYQRLMHLARLHPAVGLCLGFAHAEQIGPGIHTFEVRDFDLGGNADRGVLGRVTVEAGNPVVLPAPGQPFEVQDVSGQGHLNVKLRWPTSPDLRRLSLLSHGFNVYRVPKFVADLNPGLFLVANPARAAFLEQVRTNPAIGRVNQLPVLVGRNLDDSPAASPNSAYNPTNKLAFVADDGGISGGEYVFKDGQAFVYYVTARDILGRDGQVSRGALVILCDRMPPDGPRMPLVENHYAFEGGNSVQRLKVSWKPVPPSSDDTGISGYYVYRWSSPTEISRNANLPMLNRVSALIPHVPGQDGYLFIDSGAGAPSAGTDLNKTYWYTVRAVDLSGCGGNFSANSAPAFGVLRDRVGPDGPVGGGPLILCCEPEIQAGKASERPLDGNPDPELAYFDLECRRRDDGIAWVEFWMSFNGGVSSNYVGRVPFSAGAATAVRRVSYSRREFSENSTFTAYARVGDALDAISAQVSVRIGGLPGREMIRQADFEAYTRCARVAAGPSGGLAGVGKRGCTVHRPQRPKVPGEIDPPAEEGVIVQIPLTPSTREYRLYRRVDYGPLSLLKQGQANYHSVTNLAILIPDEDMPANASVLCYFGQLFDEHGNGSPMTQLGECIVVDQPTAKPMLAALEAVGTDAAPRMIIRWFCPPAGIERFKVRVAVLGESAPANLGTVLSGNQAGAPVLEPVNPNLSPLAWKLLDFGEYLTPMVGPDFGDGAAFSVVVPVTTGRRYYVRVTAVAKGGSGGKTSNMENFMWQAPPEEFGPKVPWPQRALPALGFFHPGIAPIRLNLGGFNGVGVRIGDVRRQEARDFKVETGEISMLEGSVRPESFLYTNSMGDSLLPVVLYRFQVPSASLPKVSGDLVQVSPYMNRIATATTNVPNVGVFTRIEDPFVMLTTLGLIPGNNQVSERNLVLLDTTPVIVGANYAYLLVRFTDLGEVDKVIPTTLVEVTP